MDIWDIIWLFFWSYVFIAYLTVLFSVLADIFRDPGLSGWAKALWVLFLVFVPIITAVVYIGTRGSDRVQSLPATDASAPRNAARSAASMGSVDEIAKAQKLLDTGSTTADEYAALTVKARGY
ncbi:hypothetical protein E3T28_07760 [Cryobacterium sinapicolor]|uniref:Cardiolipin synthase N-terminal domain-containing protein n=1 Tax=Cryobacterium sinapicolor TaxID=1259236 RepID=A0ABY2J7Q8_9MICO|nr:hypothetical protein [Cryobacterium sinapicolor]TFD00973.1 hypothetical protein E3T28_07760 [Cryobacterium sinapicolor]